MTATFSNAKQDALNPSKTQPKWLLLLQRMDQGKIANWLQGILGRADTNGVEVILKGTNAFGEVESTTVVSVGGASILTILISLVGAAGSGGTILKCFYPFLPDRYKNKIKQTFAKLYDPCENKCRRIWNRNAPTTLEGDQEQSGRDMELQNITELRIKKSLAF